MVGFRLFIQTYGGVVSLNYATRELCLDMFHRWQR